MRLDGFRGHRRRSLLLHDDVCRRGSDGVGRRRSDGVARRPGLQRRDAAAQPVDLGLQTRLHRAQRLVVRQPPRRLFVQLRLLVQTHLQARPNQLSLV